MWLVVVCVGVRSKFNRKASKIMLEVKAKGVLEADN